MVSKNARGDQERKWAAALLPRTNKTMIVITNKVNKVRNKVMGKMMIMSTNNDDHHKQSQQSKQNNDDYDKKKSTKLLPRTNKTMIIITNKVRNKVKGTMMIITNKQ